MDASRKERKQPTNAVGRARRLYLEAETIGHIIEYTSLKKEETIQSITRRLKARGIHNFLFDTEYAVQLVVETLIKEHTGE